METARDVGISVTSLPAHAYLLGRSLGDQSDVFTGAMADHRCSSRLPAAPRRLAKRAIGCILCRQERRGPLLLTDPNGLFVTPTVGRRLKTTAILPVLATIRRFVERVYRIVAGGA
jgi:hypothetical protein